MRDFVKFVTWWKMFVEQSKKVSANVYLQQFAVVWVEPFNIVFLIFPDVFFNFQLFPLAVDKLVIHYTHSWRGVAQNMVSFHKIYVLMMIIVISTF